MNGNGHTQQLDGLFFYLLPYDCLMVHGEHRHTSHTHFSRLVCLKYMQIKWQCSEVWSRCRDIEKSTQNVRHAYVCLIEKFSWWNNFAFFFFSVGLGPTRNMGGQKERECIFHCQIDQVLAMQALCVCVYVCAVLYVCAIVVNVIQPKKKRNANGEAQIKTNIRPQSRRDC